MYSSPQKVTDLNGVISRLKQIIDDAEKNNDRAGYFAALYYNVTIKVKEGVDKGQFANGDSLAKLDVMFANRYFDALSKWQKGESISKS